jgi:hypothetical protein
VTLIVTSALLPEYTKNPWIFAPHSYGSSTESSSFGISGIELGLDSLTGSKAFVIILTCGTERVINWVVGAIGATFATACVCTGLEFATEFWELVAVGISTVELDGLAIDWELGVCKIKLRLEELLELGCRLGV